MSATITYSGTLVTTTCWCGVHHAIPRELMRQAEDNGKSVYCPLGHPWVVRETRAAKLERQLEQERSRLSATRQLLEHEERSHAATRGHLTRTKKRVANGVCPCCGRTFKQLSRHMQNKHPEYVEEANG